MCLRGNLVGRGQALINLQDEEVGQATSVALSMPQAEPRFQHLVY